MIKKPTNMLSSFDSNGANCNPFGNGPIEFAKEEISTGEIESLTIDGVIVPLELTSEDEKAAIQKMNDLVEKSIAEMLGNPNYSRNINVEVQLPGTIKDVEVEFGIGFHDDVCTAEVKPSDFIHLLEKQSHGRALRDLSDSEIGVKIFNDQVKAKRTKEIVNKRLPIGLKGSSRELKDRFHKDYSDYVKRCEMSSVIPCTRTGFLANMWEGVPFEEQSPTHDNKCVGLHEWTRCRGEVKPELDSLGLPWDARINPMSRIQTRLGMWKIRRGLSGYLVSTIQDELRRKQIRQCISS